MRWHSRELDLQAGPAVMAVLNMTPDSFYSASRTPDLELARDRADKLIREGADIIDIGGCSTRPGSEPPSVREETERVVLGLQAVLGLKADMTVSVDTYRGEVARQALQICPWCIINDITAAAADPETARLAAKAGVPFIAMHTSALPDIMQSRTEYSDVAEDVAAYLFARASFLRGEGVSDIILDPGFGFGKTVRQNYALLRGLERLTRGEYPVLVGLSRKSMVYGPIGTDPEGCLAATTALNWEALQKGASILRVHDVREARQAVTLSLIYNS